MNAIAKKILAFAALAGICACAGPSGVANAPLPAGTAAHRAPQARGGGLLSNIVGVGDSLTAGYQAGGFLGQTGLRDPLFPGKLVPPGQENGWWADLDEMASTLPEAQAIAQMYDPATSPLPLIAAPGLNNQLVASQPPVPFGLLKSGNTCTDNGGFNAAGYLLSGLHVVRMDPASNNVRDVGVPGITLHEASTIFEPQNNTCEPLPGTPGLIAAVVDGESSTFWPVLGNYAGMGTNLTMVRAAASRRPTLATVWLGANDVLKYMGSGGLFVGGDNTEAQARGDMLAAIQTLKYAGAKTVVANLPNVLLTGYFMRTTIPPNAACKHPTQTYVYCVLTTLGFPGSAAKPLVTQIANAYHLGTGSCVPGSTTHTCGYLTLPGALGALAFYLAAGTLPDLDCSGANYTKPCVAGSGLGNRYITPAFAAKIQQVNDNVNAGIDDAASYTQSGFVDVRAAFDGIASGNPSNPYFRLAASISPGVCCTLAAGAGLLSFDGLHPSNTGYAMVAYLFIQAINARFGQHIREIDIQKAYNGTRCSNRLYCFPDPYAPHSTADRWLVRSGDKLEFRYASQY
jgi:lysophospholipase L1-like esterase